MPIVPPAQTVSPAVTADPIAGTISPERSATPSDGRSIVRDGFELAWVQWDGAGGSGKLRVRWNAEGRH